MLSRPARALHRAAVPAVLVATVVGLSGCTGGGGGSGSAGTSTAAGASASGPVRPTVQAPADAVLVLDDGSPEALARATSAALFVTAPVVVVAPADDADAARQAAEQGERLHAPVLLSPGTPAGTAGAPALADEVHRLKARTVLVVGTTGRAAGVPDDVAVATRLRDVPVPQAPAAPSGLTVLVPASPDPSAAVAIEAASGTARAAGASIVPVRGGDPRADPDAIAALAQHRPDHVVALGAQFGPADRLTARIATAGTGAQLPGGGQVFFPGRRLVALYGHPGTAGLGALGQQDLPASIARARSVAAEYQPLSDVPVVPTFELIATTAQGAPGKDGDYSGESSIDEIRPWVEEAGRQGLYVVLDLQPGRADLLDQAKLYQPLLELPYVGLGLDPEWKLGPGQVPLAQIGSVDVSEVNDVTHWLSDFTAERHLPQKLLVVHQFRLSMIRDEQALDTSSDQVAVLVHMDGQGPVPVKQGTWAAVTGVVPPGTPLGWKNFYVKDPRTMTPAETMAEQPAPLMISYQ